jgi:hypothetical protein
MRDTVEDSGDFVKPWKRDRMKNGRKSKKKQERERFEDWEKRNRRWARPSLMIRLDLGVAW